jgi:hypothetical protein
MAMLVSRLLILLITALGWWLAERTAWGRQLGEGLPVLSYAALSWPCRRWRLVCWDTCAAPIWACSLLHCWLRFQPASAAG